MSMTDWHEKSMRALQLAGKGERTQQAYTRSVRKLVEFFDKTPDQISETELQDYFLHRRNEDGWKPNTMRICHAGIRFFFTKPAPPGSDLANLLIQHRIVHLFAAQKWLRMGFSGAK